MACTNAACTTLSTTNTNLTNEVNTLKNKVVGLEGQITTLTGQKTTSENEKNQLKTDFENTKKANQEAITKLEGEKKALQDQIPALKTANENEKNQLKTNLENAKNQAVSKLEEEKKALEGQIATLKATHEKEKKDFEQNLANAKKTNEETSAKLNEEKKNLEGQITALKTANENEKNQLKTNLENAKNQAVSKLEEEKKTLQDQITALKTTNEKETKDFEQNLANVKKTNEETVAKLNEEKKNLEGQITALKQTNENEKNQSKADLESTKKVNQEAIAKLNEEKKNLEGQITALKATNEKEKKDFQQNLADIKEENEAVIANLETEKEILKEQVTSLENSFQKEKEKLKEELQENLQAYEDLLEENFSYSEKTKQYESLIDSQKQEIEQQKTEFSELNVENEELKSKIKEQAELVEELCNAKEKLQAEFDQFTQGTQTKLQKIEEFESKNFFEVIEHTENYDCSIIIDKICSLLAGHSWPIELKEGYMEKYQTRMEKNSLKVAVFGFENVGKSFLVRKLSGINICHKRSSKKKGISVLYSDESELSCTILEMPGTNTSIKEGTLEPSLEKYFERKGYLEQRRKETLYEDNVMMENIVEEFLFEQAQVLLIVVNRIRREDQIFLERLKKYKEKRVIIIHNFVEAHSLGIASEMIEEDIQSIFNTMPQKIFIGGSGERENRFIYRESDHKRTEHLILAREGTEAGSFYNTSTINYLKQVISTSDCSKELDLIEAFRSYLNTNIKKYVLPVDGEQSAFIELEKDNETEPLGLKLKDPTKYQLKSSKSVSQSPGAKENSYSVRIFTNPDKPKEKILRIELEVAGACEDADFKFRIDELNDQAVLKIKGKNSDDVEREEDEEILENTRRFGEFAIKTKPIDIQGYTISRAHKPVICSDTPGLKCFTFKLLPVVTNDDEEFS